MSVLRNKKQQQAIFNDVVPVTSNHSSGQLDTLLQKDGDPFIRKIKTCIMKARKDGIIIDVGCGTGSLLEAINNNLSNGCNVIGIDISAESVRLAKQKNKRVDFIVCDIDALPLRDQISDIIIIKNLLHHLSTLQPLNNLIRLLNSNGFMLIDDKIDGNPLQGILTMVYPLIPYKFKIVLREKAEHIDQYGNLPPITRYRPNAYMKFITQNPNKLTIMEMSYHGFFLILSTLEYLSRLFPRISNIALPIYKLYSLERHRILSWSAVSITIIVKRASS
jgi:ubiquinone/menaquinone biosynthesis C-methylase UbiE